MRWFGKNSRKREDLPPFWQDYEFLFSEKENSDISEMRFVVFDTETTGLNVEKDRILSIGAVSMENFRIDVQNNLELYVEQDHFDPESVKIHGLIQTEKVDKLTEYEAVQRFLKYIGNSVLVGHFVGFDTKMLNKILKRNRLPKLKNKVLDTHILYKKTRPAINLIDQNKVFTLDEIAEAYNIELHDRHTASGDAYITALIFMRLLKRFQKTDKKWFSRLLK